MRFCRLPAFALFLAAIPAQAQRITAPLGGVVRDPTSAVVPGASVRITNEGTSSAFLTTTDESGRFQAPSLAAGRYGISIEAAGFKRLERKGLVLNVDQSAEVELNLELGSSAESVEIVGEAPLLDTNSAELGQVINNQSI